MFLLFPTVRDDEWKEGIRFLFDSEAQWTRGRVTARNWNDEYKKGKMCILASRVLFRSGYFFHEPRTSLVQYIFCGNSLRQGNRGIDKAHSVCLREVDKLL